MDFILHGDFSLPLTLGYYLEKYFYAWSFQSGAPNLDGIIRLPGRLLDILVFALFGNVIASYVYIGLCFVAVFVAFFLFARYFLDIKDRAILVAGSLLYAVNPAFLGNVSKVGLVAAAGILPLCLVVLKAFINTRRLPFLLGYIVLLNFSLLHPFTFLVNLLVSGGYLAFRLLRQRSLFRSHCPKLLLAGVLAVLLNAYFLLPVLSIGTVDKSALSQDLSVQPVNYLNLVQVATTKNFFTAISLSKDVLKDYDFYNAGTKAMYIAGTYGLYVITILLYLVLQHRLSRRQKIVTLVCLGALLGIILITTGPTLVSRALASLINLPGGWVFRSPLKWQLYLPFFLITPLTMLLVGIAGRDYRRFVFGMLGLCFVLSNTFLLLDVNERLLKPKTFQVVAPLAAKNFNGQSMLYVTGDECSQYSRNHTDEIGEINEIAISNNLQVKTAASADLDRLNLTDYDYVLACEPDNLLISDIAGRFKLVNKLDGNHLRLYRNPKPYPSVSAAEAVYTSPEDGGLNAKQAFAGKYLHTNFNDVGAGAGVKAPAISQLFSGISSDNIQQGQLAVTKPVLAPATLYHTGIGNLFYRQQGSTLQLSTQPAPGFSPYHDPASLETAAGKDLNVQYRNKSFAYANLVTNPSFEAGPWKPKVGDCFKYDNNPILGMRIDSNAAQGKNSLALSAGRHLACTSHAPIKVTGGSTMLFEFSYQRDEPGNASYSIDFNDPGNTSINDQPRTTGGAWQRYSQVVKVPAQATAANISVYAYPSDSGTNPVTTRYDNFLLAQVPNIAGDFYIVSGAQKSLAAPASITARQLSPTKRHIELKGVRGPVALRVADTYHPRWQLLSAGTKPGLLADVSPWAPHDLGPAVQHVRLNNYANAWYIDTSALCSRSGACHRNADGSYDLDLTMEFWPQRWFLLGLGISALTVLGLGVAGAVGWARKARLG